MSFSSATSDKTRKLRPVRVLMDMDGVMCAFEKSFLDKYRAKYPEKPFIKLEDRRTFYLADQYRKFDSDMKAIVRTIIDGENFFGELPPFTDTLDAMREMSTMPNVEVFICTSPTKNYKYCVKEKFDWVDKHLGQDWLEKLIITKDKTMVHGDILFDDKHHVTGANNKPSWKHILVSACHNRHLDVSKMNCHGRIDGFADPQIWKDILEARYKQIHGIKDSKKGSKRPLGSNEAAASQSPSDA